MAGVGSFGVGWHIQERHGTTLYYTRHITYMIDEGQAGGCEADAEWMMGWEETPGI